MASLAVALVGVEHPGNLGAAARAMKNFGLGKLLLIEPRCDPAAEEAKNRAKWANDVLEGAELAGWEALERYDLVVALTGRTGSDYNLPRSCLPVEALAGRLAEREGDVLLLFGRESDGLTNEELARADLAATIPAAEGYPVLNLSHAVAVTLYALTRRRHEAALEERFPLVRRPELERLRQLVDASLARMGFATAQQRETHRILWHRLLAKSFLTQREAMALMAFLKKQ